MNRDVKKLMFALLRCAICGNVLTSEEKALYKPEILTELLTVAKKHDVAHLVVFGLKKNNLLDENAKKLEGEIFKAAYRCEQQKHELQTICKTLEAAQVPFIPLKGSVIREYYPEPWMRTSCDIDVLVHESDLANATERLIESGFTFERKNSHDVSFITPNGVHMELHYNLIDDHSINAASDVLKDVWETAVLHENCRYRYDMTDEMFYFYHVTHMAKHFENGGCGIRPFVDLWILEHLVPSQTDKRDELLNKGGLSIFAKQAKLLSEIWLGEAEYTELTKQMEEYILQGGVYGSTENLITVQQQKKGGKLKYALSKFFIPYDVIKFHYPILEKHRWLTPVMEVRRWGKLIFCGHLKRSVNELRYNGKLSSDTAANTQTMLHNIGL